MTTHDQDKDQNPKPGTREHFLQVTMLQRWGTIQGFQA